MRIVQGRGSNRSEFILPCATIVNRSPVQEQEQVHNIVCDILGIKPIVQAQAEAA